MLKKLFPLIVPIILLSACDSDDSGTASQHRVVLSEVATENDYINDLITQSGNCQNFDVYFSISLRKDGTETYEDMLASFNERNPGVLTEKQNKKYGEKHPTIMLSIQACDYHNFYGKNSLYLESLKYSRTFDTTYPPACQTAAMPYRLLYNSSNHYSIIHKFDILGHQLGNEPVTLFLKTPEELSYYIENGFIQQAAADKIDFQTEQVLVVSSGLNPCTEPDYEPERLCAGEAIEINRVKCVEGSTICNNANSWNLLILVIPSGDQQVKVDTRLIVCCV